VGFSPRKSGQKQLRRVATFEKFSDWAKTCHLKKLCGLCGLRASFFCVTKKAATTDCTACLKRSIAATEIHDKIKHCDFFTTRFAGVHGVHGDKRFVFAHVFFTGGNRGNRETLCSNGAFQRSPGHGQYYLANSARDIA
jgi:hypothetical protein